MTGLPKDLINAKMNPLSSFEEHSTKKADGESFKKLMDSFRENEEEESSLDTKSSEEESLNGFLTCSFLPMEIKTSMAPESTTALSSVLSSIEIAELFEQMASTIIVMSSTEEQKTTLFLNSSKFSSSPFFGTRITIKEFSTAPKAFNIEIASNPAALDLLSIHKEALVAAFESGRFPFSVHRLETQLHSHVENSSASEYPRDEDENQEHKKDDS